MAQAKFSSDSVPFFCSICLERFTDPVTIPCGHSYCMSCLKDYWDQQRAAICPQCRTAFRPRPELGRNVVLAEMMQKLGAVSLKGAPSAPPMREVLEYPGRNQVQKIVEETRRRVAAQIKEKAQEIETLQNTIQSFCLQAAAAARDSDEIFAELLDFLQRRQVEVRELIAAHQKTEASRAESRLRLLTQHVSALKRRSSQLEELSRVQDPAVIMEVFIEVGGIYDAFLLRSVLGLATLEKTHSVMCGSLSSPLAAPPGSEPWTFSPHVSFGPVRKAIADLKEQIQGLYHTVFPSVTSAVKDVKLRKIKEAPIETRCPASVPTLDKRDDLMQYFFEPSFDPFTAHKEIPLTKRNSAASRTGELQPHPDYPDRFNSWCQVLCSDGLQGRCCFEVEWDGMVGVGLAYGSIGRKGSSDGCRLGHSDTSWTLYCSATCLSFLHRRRSVQVSAGGNRHPRIGVFLHHGAGVLCFYTVAPSEVRHLHREETRFEGALFPAVWLASQSSVSFCTVDSLSATISNQ